MKKKVSKKVLSAVLSVLLLGTLFPFTALGAGFSDVPKDAWYAEDVDYVQSQGLMTGTTATTFSPKMSTTRGMIVSVLHRMAGAPTLEGSWGYPYSDVNSKAYYSQAVYWARAKGIVSGYSADKFGPNDSITREQLAAMLHKYSKYMGMDVNVGGNLYHFNDSHLVSSWAWDAMRWAVAENIIGGDQKGNLNPQGKATCAEVASVLARYVKNQDKAPSVDALPGTYPKKLAFSSGAGGWATELTLYADGSFEGEYYDYDLGVTDVYPNGVCSYNSFHGRFANITQRDAYSYTMTLEEFHNDSIGDYVADGIGYEAVSWPYGLDNAQYNGVSKNFVFYVPNTPVTNVSNDFQSWWPGRFDTVKPQTLNYYGIENVETGYGFFG